MRAPALSTLSSLTKPGEGVRASLAILREDRNPTFGFFDALESVFVVDRLSAVIVEESTRTRTTDGRLDAKSLAFAVLERLGWPDPDPVVLARFSDALERAIETETHGKRFDARDVAARLLRESKR